MYAYTSTCTPQYTLMGLSSESDIFCMVIHFYLEHAGTIMDTYYGSCGTYIWHGCENKKSPLFNRAWVELENWSEIVFVVLSMNV